MLFEAATAARTGARSLGAGWLAAEAGPAVPGDAGRTGAVAGSSAARNSAAGNGPVASAVADNSVATDAFARSAVAGNSAAGAVAAPAADAAGSPASAGHARAAAASDSGPAAARSAPGRAQSGEISEQRAAFLAPPAYAELSMPDITGPGEARGPAALARDAASAEAATPRAVSGSDGEPILWQPLKPASGEAQGGAGSGQGSPSNAGGPDAPGGPGGPGGNGWLRFWNRSGPSKPSSGRWRLMVAGAGIAAIVIAALVGWDIYARTQTTQALSPSPIGTHAVGSSRSAHPSGRGSTRADGKHGSAPATGKQGAAPPPGHSLGSGQPSTGPSRKPSSSASPSTHPSPSASVTPTPSASPTPSPSTSPRGTGPVLPPGWDWHDFSAAELGATAGFKIGLPGAWTQNLTGQIAHFNQPVRNFHLVVSVGLWTYPKPLAEAKYLARKDAANYNGYTQLVLGAVGFKAIGGFKAAPAAELKFSWTKPAGGSFTELVTLVSLMTKAGVQTYRFSLWAPTASFGAAHSVAHTAVETFRPLPAV
jgi:hypothetical protein